MKFYSRTEHEFETTPPKRTLSEKRNKGIIVLDKPSGPTSHQTVSYLKRIIECDKAGHGGTLDPKVTGVLPVALGRATKIAYAILGSDKVYVALAYFHDSLTSANLDELLSSFTGTIDQLPPVKSAVKRQWRKRKVHQIDVLDVKGQHVLMKIRCEGGTYIRKLIHDMGDHLDMGAHMQELRRIQAGPFTEQSTVSLQEVQDYYDFYREELSNKILNMIRPMEEGVSHLPKIIAHNSTKKSLSHGAQLKIPGVVACTDVRFKDKVAVLSQDYELILIGEARKAKEALLSEERGIAVKTRQVYMRPEEV